MVAQAGCGMTRVLCCGGRDYENSLAVVTAMDVLLRDRGWQPGQVIVIEGGAKGADRLARHWAESRGAHVATVSAQWRLLGKAAGMKRNVAMLALRPELCVAFPGGTGTEHMATICFNAGIPVWRPYK